MKRKGFIDSRAFKAICSMPNGKKHKPRENYFSWSDSEVVQWLISQEEVHAYLFNKARESGAIVYDQQTGTWHGKDFQPENL